MCQAGGVIVEKRIIVIRRVTVPRQISNQIKEETETEAPSAASTVAVAGAGV